VLLSSYIVQIELSYVQNTFHIDIVSTWLFIINAGGFFSVQLGEPPPFSGRRLGDSYILLLIFINASVRAPYHSRRQAANFRWGMHEDNISIYIFKSKKY
jgi:hypothetical protein